MLIRSIVAAAALIAVALSPVLAKGCIRGAIAGGVAGHYAGRHGLVGAAGGCLAGRAYYKHKAKVAQQQAAQKQQLRPVRR